MRSSRRHLHGFTSAELLLVLAMGAVIIGGVVVSMGSLIKNQPRVSSVVEVDLGSKPAAYYGISDTKVKVTTAPNYGAVALAEKMRELFNNDVIGATAVFCLSRDNENTYHPASIAYNPATDVTKTLDTSLQFRAHLIAKSLVTPSLFGSDRNFSTKANASIFILGFSKTPGQLTVNAIYDIDVVKVVRPDGFYASVKRYTNTAAPQYYDVFYPPFDYNSSRWPTTNGTTDGFTPIWVSFERSARAALSEGSSIDRFKKAAERPFYYIWWPDPAARDLRRQPNSYPTSDPRNAYNHQGGRTSFMFSVPMFPAL